MSIIDLQTAADVLAYRDANGRPLTEGAMRLWACNLPNHEAFEKALAVIEFARAESQR